jgi:hypothetical protein
MITKIKSSNNHALQRFLDLLNLNFLRKCFFPLILFTLFNNSLFAQRQYNPFDDSYRSPFIYGISAGINNSIINDLEYTILSEPFFLNYNLDTAKVTGITIVGFLNYRVFFNNHVGLQLDFAYSKQGSDLNFKNNERNFDYKIQFKYEYLNINPSIKIYGSDYGGRFSVLEHLNATAGLRFGFNLCPSNIFYRSGGSGYSITNFGTDLNQQQQLRNVLKGNSNVGWFFGFGYEIANFSLDVKWNHTFNDVVETLANSYNFKENDNRNDFFQITLSGYLPWNQK